MRVSLPVRDDAVKSQFIYSCIKYSKAPVREMSLQTFFVTFLLPLFFYQKASLFLDPRPPPSLALFQHKVPVKLSLRLWMRWSIKCATRWTGVLMESS